MNKAAQQAIERELSYLEDNRYRYVQLGGYSADHPTVASHDAKIAELKAALREAGCDSEWLK